MPSSARSAPTRPTPGCSGSSSRSSPARWRARLHALFAVSLRADQIVSGTAINLLALGITGYLYVDIYGTDGTPDDLPQVPDVSLPIDDIPFFGDVFGQLNLLVWIGLIMVPLTWLIVFRTPLGLRLRSAGENPLAAETAGLSVIRTRYLAVMASGSLAAMGGAFLSIGFVNSFTQNMTAGRGFIALAALIFGRWRPWGALAATLLFGFGSALAQRLPVFSESGAVLFQALPYVLTLIAVTGVVGRLDPTRCAWTSASEVLTLFLTDEEGLGDDRRTRSRPGRLRWGEGAGPLRPAHPRRAHRRAAAGRDADTEADAARHTGRDAGDRGAGRKASAKAGSQPRRPTSACRRRSRPPPRAPCG